MPSIILLHASTLQHVQEVLIKLISIQGSLKMNNYLGGPTIAVIIVCSPLLAVAG